jgi:putative phosphoribosyl transferase
MRGSISAPSVCANTDSRRTPLFPQMKPPFSWPLHCIKFGRARNNCARLVSNKSVRPNRLSFHCSTNAGLASDLCFTPFRIYFADETIMSVPFFRNRMHAGKLLARRLDSHANRPDTIVLALPRGGVPVGFAVAQALHVPLDIIVVRKLGVPWEKELAMGAIAGDGTQIIRNEVALMRDIPDEVLEETARRERVELQRRDRLYRSGRARPQLDGLTVILVDDGLATGASMMAAVLAVRAQHPAYVIVAAPVGAPDTCRMLGTHADEVVCLEEPESFRAVSLWYDEFPQTGDAEVIDLLEQAQHLLHAAANAALQAGKQDAPSQSRDRP